MSKVFADTIESPNEDGTVTIGTSTNTVTATGNIVQANTVKDSGGNTLWTSDGAGNLSSVNSALTGNLKLLSTQTASGASSVEFTSGIDSTYDVYIFKFVDVNPATDNVKFTFNGSDDTLSWSYDVVKTTSYFNAEHAESGAAGALYYKTNHDLAQSTGYQPLTYELGSDADQCLAGELYLFNPASTTYVTHFYYVGNQSQNTDMTLNPHVSGYFNTTSAITALDFKMNSGNFDGIIKMYGLL